MRRLQRRRHPQVRLRLRPALQLAVQPPAVVHQRVPLRAPALDPFAVVVQRLLQIPILLAAEAAAVVELGEVAGRQEVGGLLENFGVLVRGLVPLLLRSSVLRMERMCCCQLFSGKTNISGSRKMAGDPDNIFWKFNFM